jgi:hypothetical protein
MNEIRDRTVATLAKMYESNIEKHLTNVEVMLSNPTAIHEHSDYVGAIELELAKIAEYHDLLEVVREYLG